MELFMNQEESAEPRSVRSPQLHPIRASRTFFLYPSKPAIRTGGAPAVPPEPAVPEAPCLVFLAEKEPVQGQVWGNS